MSNSLRSGGETAVGLARRHAPTVAYGLSVIGLSLALWPCIVPFDRLWAIMQGVGVGLAAATSLLALS